MIGRTCLYPIPNPRHEAVFPTISWQTANLFGVPFGITSLPFQEQDHEVGACATSALWSVLNATSRLFSHPVLSPIEITNRALDSFPVIGRGLPNDGLNVYQMAGVAQSLGLEAELIDARNKDLLKSCAYAYLQCGIPVVLGIDFNTDPKSSDPRELHAVALTGYSLSAGPALPTTETGFLLKASRVDCFYVHDDGVGPFAPLQIDDDRELVITRRTNDEGDWKEARPDQMLVPLYSQIRTHFIEVLEATAAFDHVFETVRSEVGGIQTKGRVEWDVYLVDVRNYKNKILKDYAIDRNEKVDTLTKPLPHFMWVVSASVGEAKILEFLFDATDLRQGRQLVHFLPYDESVRKSLEEEFGRFDYRPYVGSSLTRQMITFIADRFE